MGRFNRTQEVAEAVPNNELRFKLGIKPKHKVCLFRSPKYFLHLFLTGDLKLAIDWIESDSDVILYWLQPNDNVADIMANLEQMIKRNGRIWLIAPQGEIAKRLGYTASWEDVKSIVLEATSLVEGKTLCLSDGARGTQFSFKKAVRGVAAIESD